MWWGVFAFGVAVGIVTFAVFNAIADVATRYLTGV